MSGLTTSQLLLQEGLKLTPYHNVSLYEISELIVPIINSPASFPLVEKIIATSARLSDSSRGLSQNFLVKLLENDKALYSKLSTTSRQILWSVNTMLYQAEVLI